MATSGYSSVAVTSWDTLKFSWWFNASDQSVTNNTTLVRWKLELIAGSDGAISSSATKAWSVTVNGQQYNGNNTVGISANSTKTLASGTTLVTHNDDGSKIFNYSYSQQFDIDFSGWVGTKSGSSRGTLTTIPRASQPSCITWPEHTQNVGSFGDTISIHMNRKSSSFTHTVRYAFGDRTGTIATGVGTGTTWTIPLSLMELLPAVLRGSGTIYADTYNGSTLIGTKSCGFTATVPASVEPSCTVQVVDATATQGKYGNLVRGLSKLKVTVRGTQAYNSPIATYNTAVTYPTAGKGFTQHGSAEFTTAELAYAGTVAVSATVTDKRGRTSNAASASFTVLDYNHPAINYLAVHRCNQDGTENDQGEYVKVTFSAAITPLNNKNSAAYKLRYKQSNATSYTEVALTAQAGKYTVTEYSHIFAANSDYSYDVEVEAKDDNHTTIRATSASTASTFMDWDVDNNSIAFGKVAEGVNTMEIAMHRKQIGNSYSYQPGAFNGERGYTLLAVISLNQLNVNAPIVFTINRRGALCPMRVYVRFASSSSTTDPGLGSITYEGDNFGAFLVKAAASTWKLYVDNTGGWSNPCLQEWYTTDNQNSRLSLDFPSEQVATLPEPYYRATPAKTRSILDYVYPVGSIYLSYNHTNPGTLFGGTWERIENTFLWACDAAGEIGTTGGSKTHTLTANELPSHTHNVPVANTATGSVAANNTIRFNNNASSFKGTVATVATGGGQPHNNMPPYIQVAVWRRTA